jgi:hypothetical protein
MADVYTLGLAKIEIGDIANDGGLGSTLAVLGQTLEDSCTVTQEDPTVTEFFAEELDDAVISIGKRGKTTIAFSVMNPDTSVLLKVLGGTVTGGTDGAVAKWHSPLTLPVIEKSMRITPLQGLIWEFPRVKIVAKINGSFSRKNVFVIEIAGTALQPSKAGEPSYTAYELVEA